MPKEPLSTKIMLSVKLAADIITEGQFLQTAQMYLAADLCKVFFACATVLFLNIGPQVEQLGNIFGSDYGKWVSRPSG